MHKKHVRKSRAGRKPMRKLEKQAPENAVDPKKTTRVKQLVIETRGQDRRRLARRVFASDEQLYNSDISHIVLMLRDGLAQKRLDGLAAATRLLERDDFKVWAQRLMLELGPRIVDVEAKVRFRAQMLMLAIIKLFTLNDTAARELSPVCYSHIRSHIKSALSAIRLSIVGEGLAYMHAILVQSPNFAEENFLESIIPLFIKQDDILSQPLTRKKRDKIRRFDVEPFADEWAALYLVTFHLICALIVDKTIMRGRSITQLARDMIRRAPSAAAATSDGKYRSAKSKNDFRECRKLGDNIPAGRLLIHTDRAIRICETMSENDDIRPLMKMVILLMLNVRWIICLTLGAELIQHDDLTSFYEILAVNAGARAMYQKYASSTNKGPLSFLAQSMSLATSVRKLAQLSRRIDVEPVSRLCFAMRAEYLQALAIIAHFNNGLADALTALQAEWPDAVGARMADISFDTHCFIAYAFGSEGLVPDILQPRISSEVSKMQQVTRVRDDTQAAAVATENAGGTSGIDLMKKGVPPTAITLSSDSELDASDFAGCFSP